LLHQQPGMDSRAIKHWTSTGQVLTWPL